VSRASEGMEQCMLAMNQLCDRAVRGFGGASDTPQRHDFASKPRSFPAVIWSYWLSATPFCCRFPLELKTPACSFCSS